MDIPTLIDAFLYWACRFCDPDLGDDGKSSALWANARKHYSGDAVIFEWGCYLIFRAHVWHIEHNRLKEAKEVLVPLRRQFVDYFALAFGPGVEDVLVSRVEEYADLVDGGTDVEKLSFTVQQLIEYSVDESVPKIRKIEELPVIIGGFLDTTHLEIAIKGQEIHVVPRLLEMFEKTYEFLDGEST